MKNNFKERVNKLETIDILQLLQFNRQEQPSKVGLIYLKEMLTKKLEYEEVDEIELIVIESGN